MNIADWVILGVVVCYPSVMAHREGFFHEAFGIGRIDRGIPAGGLAVSVEWQPGLLRI